MYIKQWGLSTGTENVIEVKQMYSYGSNFVYYLNVACNIIADALDAISFFAVFFSAASWFVINAPTDTVLATIVRDVGTYERSL